MNKTNLFNKLILTKAFLVFTALIIPIFLVVSIVNMDLFIVLSEISIVIVCVILSMVGILTAFRTEDNFLSRISPYIFAFTVFMLMNTLSSSNISLFVNISDSFSFNCWIVAVGILAIGFMINIIDFSGVFKTVYHLGLVGAFSIVFFFLVYYDIFPATRVDNGVSIFGFISQFISIFIYLISIVLWYSQKQIRENKDYKLMRYVLIGLLISDILMINHFSNPYIMVYLSLTLKHLSLMLLMYVIFLINLILPYEELYNAVIEDNEIQKKLMQENVENYDRLQRTQKIAHVGTWELDIKNNLVWASDEAFKIYDIDVSENNILDFSLAQAKADQSDRAKLDYALESLIKRGVPYDEFYRINTDKNTQKNIHSVANLKYKNGIPDKVFGVIMDITELSKEQAKLRYTSYHDHLTGVYNRRYFIEHTKFLDNEKYYPLACIYLDINGLKIINDSFGHKVGNGVLRKVASILEKNANSSKCFVSRIGGDEFTIICPNTSLEQAEFNILDVIQKFNFEKVGNITLSVAYGIAVKTNSKQTFDEVLTKAENEMYMNKLSSSLSFSNKIIDSLLNTLYEKEAIAEAHATSVSKLSSKLATALNLSPKKINDISMIARIHDIGKIGLPEEIVNKPGKYTDEEFEIVKTHSEKGYKIIKSLSGMDLLASHILHHHERWDGLGYPDGQMGNEISIEARILAICDAYDAMTNKRTYQKTKTLSQAIKELKACKGKQFDPAMVDVFIREVLNNKVDD